MAVFSSKLLLTSAPFSQRGAPDTLPPQTGPAHRLDTIQHMAQGGRWRMEAMRALSEPCLYWITRGQGRVTVGGVQRGYGVHNAIFLPAGVMHGLELGANTQGLVLFFGRDHDPTLPANPQHLRVREATAQSELTALLEALNRESSQPRIGSDRAAEFQMGLISVWLERQIAVAPQDSLPPKNARKLVNRFTALVERDFRSSQTVSDYARQLRVTPTHLSRVCRDACGRPASDLLQERRLYEARRLLLDTQMPIKEIAARLGFRSQTYFSRNFLAQTGSTPSKFRQSGH
ncbi:AraC family transcriptional regulator [Thioclava kandeliae]|uniref:AraC family transcriptional regulator n=1 Tax=Thioclava kandeliae TaxID=3070818 RepID=A0ABV1SFN9_9RHOB